MSLLGRALLGGLTLAAGMLAYRLGGGADARIPPPAPKPAAITAPAAPGGDGDEVRLRLLDAMKDARVDAPQLRSGLLLLRAHWRKMQAPWANLSGTARELGLSIALRTSRHEAQWVVPTGSGKVWAPSARVWNLSEGSYDQREAIFAPTPASITFHLTVPPQARLTFAPGTVNARGDATVFSVSVVDSRGTRTRVYEKRFLPEQTAAWGEEQSADLSAFADQDVDLVLETRADRRAPGEHPPRESRDAGPPDAEGRPGLSLALWADPTVLSHGPTRLPYNVLFIVIDALRADVLSTFHDDAEDRAKRAARYPPGEALFPKVPGIVPNLDALAMRGVRFTHAYSGGAWTRPGTLAMLSGERSTQLGIDPLSWVLADPMADRYYRSDPPQLALLLRRAGAETRAFVNNYFMVGYAPVGIDMGFERVDDHRYRTRDTAIITSRAVAWLKEHAGTRFFAFVNYNSPHAPLDPPQRLLDRIPPPPVGPSDPMARRYMAEASKDDEAVGELMQTLDALKVRDRTIVVVTADHGETFSAAHSGILKLDHMPIRYHHAASNFEESTHVPILMSLPGVLPAGKVVADRIRNTDIAPTLLELLGQDPNPKMTGRSLMPLVRGDKEQDPRLVVTEGRGTRGVLHGRYRAIFREGAARTTIHGDHEVTVAQQLFDLDEDPGERHDIARSHPEIVAELRARLAADKERVPAADAHAGVAKADPSATPRVRFRFAGAGQAHRISGSLTFESGGPAPAVVTFDPVGIDRSALRLEGASLEVAFSTAPDAPVGFDVRVDPPAAAIDWRLTLDDAPWPDHDVFAGPFGLFDGSVQTGLADDMARAAAYSPVLPEIDPARDLGMFVTREKRGERSGPVREQTAQGAAEMNRLLEDWGYAHGKGGK